ncbi:MAG: outer membrane beta-barrel protein [Betaproteobacteria bacterium]
MKKLALVLSTFLVSTAFAQSKNFEGLGVAFDYSLNSITDVSNPGSSVTTRSGIPSLTIDFNKAISNKILLGVYGTYDLATTDTSGSDPDAQHPFELGAKTGFAFTESLMGYVKLGYSWSRYSSQGYYKWLEGPSYGLGVEYLISKSLFTRAEISQQNYKKIYWSDGSTDKMNINSVGVSIGYRF